MFKSDINNKAGIIINSGSFGCVFHPSLECDNMKSSYKYISKLMLYKDAIEEYEISIKLKQIFSVVLPDYKKYIILTESICNIKFISNKDITGYDKCYLFQMLNIKEKNVNSTLHNLIILNQKYGGIELTVYLMSHGIKKILKSFIDILSCIVLINKHGVYHSDIKSSNLLVNKNRLYIIDWGLTKIKPSIEDFSHNKTFSFNNPFGSILFSNIFKQYCDFGVDVNTATRQVNLFMEHYEKNGHFVFIKEVILFFNLNSRCIENYLIKILTAYTKEEYFKIFLHNLDLWGIISCFMDFFNIQDKKCGYDIIYYLYTDVGYLNVQKIAKLIKNLNRANGTKRKQKNIKTKKNI